MDYGGPEFLTDVHIPVDLFISKKSPKGLAGGSQLRFTNSCGDIIFKFDLKRSQYDQPNKRLLLDASSGNPLVSIVRIQKGSWQVFREDNNEEKHMIYKVERTVNSFSRIEFEVFVMNGDIENQKSELKIKGSPFHRSCTIYTGDTIVAQTSLMYKLGIQKVFVPRNKFRLTIFPGYSNHAFIVALVIIFFHGRKLWI